MSLLLVVVHIIVCIALIMIVLLQSGKGADMGAAFGGGSSQTLFGSTGASTFLSKATTVVAVMFMITCLSLAYISGNKVGGSVVKDDAPIEEGKAEPKEQTATAQPTPIVKEMVLDVGTTTESGEIVTEKSMPLTVQPTPSETAPKPPEQPEAQQPGSEGPQ